MTRVSRKKLLLSFFFLILIGGGLVYWKSAQGVNRTWDGGGVDGTCGGAGTANNWSCPANWSGDTAPTASDVAIFDGTSTKDATINSAVSVAGISINAGYTGTITQSGTNTITVGSSNFSQSAGTFTGGSGAIAINSGTYTLTGGTFTSTSGTLTISYGSSGSATIFTVSSGTFSHNNGTVNFSLSSDGYGDRYFTVDVPTTLTFYNIISNVTAYDSGIKYLAPGSGDTIIATNDFTQSEGGLSGTWEVQGNITIGAGADGGGGTLTYTTGGSHTYTHAGGVGPHLGVNHVSAVVTPAGGTTSLTVTKFSLLAGAFTAPSGTMSITYEGGSTTIFTVSSGATFSHNNGTVAFIPSYFAFGPSAFTVDVATSLTLYNITVAISWNDSGGTKYLIPGSGDTIIAANNFTFTDGFLEGTWEVQGNITIGAGADGDTANIVFTGSNNQTYTDQGGDEPDGDVTINKTSGIVTLANNADWNATSQDVIITSGILSLASYTVATTDITISSGGLLLVRGGGDITLGGTLSNNGIIRMQDGDCGSADISLIRSSSTGVQRSWNGTGTFSLYDVDVRDMAGSSAITLYSSTSTANNGANWTFSGASCPAQPSAAGLSAGKMNLQSGKMNLR